MSWLNPEADESIKPETANKFWLIILTTWMMEELDAWKDYAESVESNTKW